VHWFAVRLELARTQLFPKGSMARAYIVHLPLSDGGFIDGPAMQRAPANAIVRRYWPGEADLVGFVIAADQGWAFSYRDGPEDDDRIFNLTAHCIKRGEYLTVSEPSGNDLPYRVAELVPLIPALRPGGRRQTPA
jgi:hypothetical protein